jgi:hypothetical protein
MERSASIEVTLRSGDTPVRQFVRVCPEDADQIRRVTEHAIGWLQAWSCQLSDEQWQSDTRAQERLAS